MRQLRKKEKILAGVAATVLIGVVLIQFDFTLPKVSVDLDSQIRIKKRLISDALDLLDLKEKILEEALLFSKYIRAEGSVDAETVDFIGEIEAIAKDTSVEIIDLKPFAPEKISSYSLYKVEMEAEAPIGEISKFMYSIQNSASLLRIQTFRISPKTDTVDVMKVYMTVTKMFIS